MQAEIPDAATTGTAGAGPSSHAPAVGDRINRLLQQQREKCAREGELLQNLESAARKMENLKSSLIEYTEAAENQRLIIDEERRKKTAAEKEKHDAIEKQKAQTEDEVEKVRATELAAQRKGATESKKLAALEEKRKADLAADMAAERSRAAHEADEDAARVLREAEDARERAINAIAATVEEITAAAGKVTRAAEKEAEAESAKAAAEDSIARTNPEIFRLEAEVVQLAANILPLSAPRDFNLNDAAGVEDVSNDIPAASGPAGSVLHSSDTARVAETLGGMRGRVPGGVPLSSSRRRTRNEGATADEVDSSKRPRVSKDQVAYSTFSQCLDDAVQWLQPEGGAAGVVTRVVEKPIINDTLVRSMKSRPHCPPALRSHVLHHHCVRLGNTSPTVLRNSAGTSAKWRNSYLMAMTTCL